VNEIKKTFPKIMGPSDKRDRSPSSSPITRKNAKHAVDYGNAVEGRGPMEFAIESSNLYDKAVGGALPIKVDKRGWPAPGGVDDFLKLTPRRKQEHQKPGRIVSDVLKPEDVD